MKHESYEPQPSAQRPCATPHSAPVAWLQSETPSQAEPGHPPEPPPATEPEIDALAALAVRDPNALAEAIARATPEGARDDGWNGFSRRLFLQVLAETGRVSTACQWTGLTRQSAYALRSRDPLFSAGWDAACLIARMPLADELYEKALDGVTDAIVKDGVVVAERRRFDSRLSTAVLARLDKRCDRAEELGSPAQALVQRWDEWLGLVGKGEDEAAAAMLDSARDCQKCQLPESANPTEEPPEDEPLDLSDRCWRDPIDTDLWMTDFPPPPGFDGYESRPYDDIEDEEPYVRVCTEQEVAILEADAAAYRAAERSEDEALRDAWFELLRRHPGSE